MFYTNLSFDISMKCKCPLVTYIAQPKLGKLSNNLLNTCLSILMIHGLKTYVTMGG